MSLLTELYKDEWIRTKESVAEAWAAHKANTERITREEYERECKRIEEQRREDDEKQLESLKRHEAEAEKLRNYKRQQDIMEASCLAEADGREHFYFEGKKHETFHI